MLMISFLSKNYRGADHQNFVTTMFYYVQMHHPTLLVILEPKTSGDIVPDVIQKLTSSDSFVVDTTGRAGGIWVLCNNQKIQLNVFRHSTQAAHFWISWKGEDQWFVLFVYGDPGRYDWFALWKNLIHLQHDFELSWLVMGDFNASISAMDTQRGAEFSIPRAKDFKNCLDMCYNFDLGFMGP